ncbi:restriction endonuclease subunit S [Dickeya dadantii]|uniref:restriction endonuclease subunit S n=1 Tax=Dickeya dadantii TaxID=204038 RepID=UPI001C0CD3F3|nr:restriction endonuclease subunit S [Dickeya dadantii]QWT39181.1 restriction endonuclease subunit S [Dickeya dadantii]
MVPKGWEKKHLKDILSEPIRNGFSPVASDRETGFWILSLGSLGDEGINVTEIKPVEPIDRVLQTQLSHGDFLVSRSNTPDKVGRSIYFQGEVENCSYPDLMMKFRIDEDKADPIFIEQQLKSLDVRAYFKNCAAGSSSTMVKINKGILEKTPLLLPNIKEQKKIAQILSTWDKAITITEQLFFNSLKHRDALMQQLLTGKKRFPGFNGEWKMEKIGRLLKVRKEKQVPSDDVPLFSLTIENGVTAKTDRYNREFLVKNDKEKKYKLVKPRDIVYNPANIRWGAINYSKLKHSVVVSPIYEVLYVVDKKAHNLEFIAQSLMSKNQINKFAAMIEGTLVERMAVKIEPFLATKLLVPPTLKEQEKISLIFLSNIKEIEILQTRLNYLKQEKKALMQQLLTGKRRVKTEVA